MFLLRILVFTILFCILLILAYPLAILYDISQGGSGYGLCQDLMLCEIGFVEGPMIFLQLVIIFFLLISLLRVCMHIQKSLSRDS